MRPEIITKRLKEQMQTYFEKNHISQKKYAEQINIHPKTLSNYINGYREMPYEILSRISKDMDIDLNYIFKNTKANYTLDRVETDLITQLRELSTESKAEACIAFKALINMKR